METFKKAISAGIMIGIGSTIYLICSNKIVGALLFSIALFVIFAFNLNLFTGKIGYIIENKNKPNCVLIWLGNLVGCLFCAVLIRIAKPEISEIALEMVNVKLSYGLVATIILSIFCGILMYIAAENYKNNNSEFGKQIGVFLCVPVFILCGFEHSIADMCYCIFAVNSFAMALQAFLFIIVVSVSNSLGAILFRCIAKIGTKTY